MFSPTLKKKTEEKELKEEKQGEGDDDSPEPDEKKPKLEGDEETKASTKDSEEK